MRERCFVIIDGKTTVTGLFGWPVAHSLSPAMHNTAFKEKRLNFCYVPFPVREENLAWAVKSISTLNLKGVNVTAPHKEAACSLLHRLSGEAEFLGAINTVIREDGGELVGYNTDVEGFRFLLQENLPQTELQGARAVLLGAGGAARSAALVFARAGVGSLTIVNRTVARAETLASLLVEKGKLGRDRVEALPLEKERLKGLLNEADLVVNSLSADPFEIGLLSEEGPFPPAVVDLRYNPPLPPFLEWAESGGAKAVNGLDMLLGQGTGAFELFTGKKAPAEAMRNALLRSLGRS